MLGFVILGIVSSGVAFILFRFVQRHLLLGERILNGDASLLDEKGFHVDHVTQAPLGTQFFPPGTKLILSGQAAIDLQNNLQREMMNGVPSSAVEDEAQTTQ
mgnify:FL=1